MNIPFLSLILLVTLFDHFLPGWTRPDLFFAVTVDPAFRRTRAGLAILRRYRVMVWSATAAACGLYYATDSTVAAVLLHVVVFMLGFVTARRQALAFAASVDPVIEVDLAASAETLPGGLALSLAPGASLLVLTFWAFTHWGDIPARFPRYWGSLVVEPVTWADRTPGAVYGFLAMHLLGSLLLVLAAWGLLHWSRRIAARGAPAAGERRFRSMTAQVMIATAWLLAVQAWISLVKPDEAMIRLWRAAVILVVAIYMIRLVRAGQGGARALSAANGSPAGDRTPDSCWKWGMFYFNPADPAIFIEKRFGLGYTLNFANRWSWAVMGLLAVAVIAKLSLR